MSNHRSRGSAKKSIAAPKKVKTLKPLSDKARVGIRADFIRLGDNAKVQKRWQKRGYTRQQIAGIRAALTISARQ